MSLSDFLFCVAFAVAGGEFVEIRWYGAAAFCAMMLYILVSNIELFHFKNPQPRYFVGTAVIKTEAELEKILNQNENQNQNEKGE